MGSNLLDLPDSKTQLAAGQTYSLLDHLRHLLANDPDLVKLHLTGGLNTWAYRNTQKILQ